MSEEKPQWNYQGDRNNGFKIHNEKGQLIAKLMRRKDEEQIAALICAAVNSQQEVSDVNQIKN